MSALMFLIWLVAEISVGSAQRNQPNTVPVPGFTYLGSTSGSVNSKPGRFASLNTASFAGSNSASLAKFNTIDYYISNQGANQTTAQIVCKKVFGGYLAAIRNANQDTDLRHYLENLSLDDPVWTSGRRDDTNGPWYWSTNLTPIIYTNWLAEEPIDCFNCISVYRQGLAYGWWSNPCALNLRYVCEA